MKDLERVAEALCNQFDALRARSLSIESEWLALRNALSALPASAGSDETRVKLPPEALPAGEGEHRDIKPENTPPAAVSGDGLSPCPTCAKRRAFDGDGKCTVCRTIVFLSTPPAASDEEKFYGCVNCCTPIVASGMCETCSRAYGIVRAEATETERERCARHCDVLAHFMETGAGPIASPGARLRQAAQSIREGDQATLWTEDMREDQDVWLPTPTCGHGAQALTFACEECGAFPEGTRIRQRPAGDR